MSAFSDLDWNADLDDITSQGPQNRRSSTGSPGGPAGVYDWNMDLDDLIDGTYSKETRRHSAPTSLPSRKKDLAVRFGKVHIRECERVLGDNPACETGPSISIGWRHETLKPIHIDTWEALRCEKRRNKQNLYMDEQQRVALLVQAGYAKRDIQRNIQTISSFHRQRNETLQHLYMDKKLAHLADKLHSRGESTVYC